MPELPEVEITARRLGEALAGAPIEDATAQGLNTLKSLDPPLTALRGARIAAVRRRGKLVIVDADNGISLLIHLMSGGRLQLHDARPPGDGGSSRDHPARASGPRAGASGAGPRRDRSVRLTLRLDDGRELRLREFGTKQAAWAKPLRTDAIDSDEAISKLGPEAWPAPPPFAPLIDRPRPLHALLRDQRVIAGIGRSWADEILWSASLSPFKRGSTLSPAEAEGLRAATVERLQGAVEHYEREVRLPIPNRMPMPLLVHRHVGEPCPRCGTPIA
ncbi:MAG: DNA-formamidopyrimidine glycosylase, partial [Acidobacteriota bacterium]|nr:DNA-formamidopyrimidine glycosylase [Acidobacteriota bacterium]